MVLDKLERFPNERREVSGGPRHPLWIWCERGMETQTSRKEKPVSVKEERLLASAAMTVFEWLSDALDSSLKSSLSPVLLSCSINPQLSP